LWRQYVLRFDVESRAVIVQLGPIVNTSQQPFPQDGEPQIGRAAIQSPFWPLYGEETRIDIFGGPSFSFEWRKGRVEINFIPWHRRWSHSIPLAALSGLAAALAWGPLAGIIMALGFAIHIAEDQLGFLGSNLLFPLTRRRTNGLRLVHSGEPAPHLFTAWTMLLLILFNLDRYSPNPMIAPLPFFALAWGPALFLLGAYIFNRSRTCQDRPAFGKIG
jgi:membrane-bound metal-dependent hydrolase YbcI (DUF457 family)